jgi:hypothetical protein
MRTAEAKEAFESLVASRGLQADTLDASSAVDILLDFFAGHRADDVEFEAVYLNWGTVDWHDGTGPTFDYVIWRQFFVAGTPPEDADDGIWELEYRFTYAPGPESDALGSGGEMCEGPDDVARFRAHVEALPASAYAWRTSPLAVEFRFGRGG